MNIKYLVLILIFSILTSCSATGPKFSSLIAPADGNAVIYLYRPSQFVGSMIVPPIYLNNQHIFDLPNNGYARLEIEPGEYIIESRKKISIVSSAQGKVTINVKAGSTHYMTWQPTVSNSGVSGNISYASFSGGFMPVNSAIAIEEIKNCNRVYPKNK